MAVWVDGSSSSGYFSGWSADMGPYIGPWPLLPPGEVGGLVSGDELDFYVAIPNPADTTDPTIVGDGTYGTPIWDAWRKIHASPPTTFGYFGDVTGATSSVPATPSPGAHLYVVAYAAAGMPPHPPEFYVPPSYAAGGASALQTAMGHWSSIQPGFTQTKHVLAAGGGDAYSVSASVVHAGDYDIPTAAGEALADLYTATPVSGGTASIVSADKRDQTVPGGVFFDTTAGMDAHIGWVPYNGATALADDQPPALAALTYDVDYVENPFIDAAGNAGPLYQYSSPATWAWAAGAADGVNIEQYGTSTSVPGSVTLPLGLVTRVQWIAGALSVSGRPLTVSANLLADIVSPSLPIGSGSPIPPYAFDYSAVTTLQFVTFTAPLFLYTGAVPPGVNDFAMPLGNDGYTDSQSVATSSPDLVIDRSTWQFWVPGAIVPTLAWHTAGGHWATPGGAEMRILTPGVGWVPVVDGPA